MYRANPRISWLAVWGLVVCGAAPGEAPAEPAKREVSSEVSPAVSKASSIKATAARAVVKVESRRPPAAEARSLHAVADALKLKSNAALVIDQDTDQVLFSKNPQAVLPIASITKLMTAMVVVGQQLDLSETITVTADDIDTEKGSHSRLTVGTPLTRGEMLHLALMASENRAAHALGRTAPGGLETFVAAMNATAQRLGMRDTRYREPTGLSSQNQSSARDLALLVKAAYEVPLIRQLSTSPEAEFEVGRRSQQFRNTNRLVNNPTWDIGLQKTGYIAEAGRCLVMQAQLAGRKLIMVLLDSAGKYSRLGDAERIRKWVGAHIHTGAGPADDAAGDAVNAIHTGG
jgi:D-alanyl-D-alanine endopeptidase (penicillin-binding protein 7)